MKDNSKLVAIILSISAVLVVVLSLIFNNKSTSSAEIKIVENYSDFYTVNSCLYRTITYISSQDKNTLLLILNNQYKKQNKIDEENVLTFFPKVESNSTFVSRKMYYQKLNSDLTKYYVYGYIQNDQFYEDAKIDNRDNEDVYFIVYLDTNKKIFSVEPYSGEVFIGGDYNE